MSLKSVLMLIDQMVFNFYTNLENTVKSIL